MLFAASAPRPDCPVASAAGVRELLGDLLLGPVTPTCRLPSRSFPRPQALAVLAHSRRRFCRGHAGSGTLPGRATRARPQGTPWHRPRLTLSGWDPHVFEAPPGIEKVPPLDSWWHFPELAVSPRVPCRKGGGGGWTFSATPRPPGFQVLARGLGNSEVEVPAGLVPRGLAFRFVNSRLVLAESPVEEGVTQPGPLSRRHWSGSWGSSSGPRHPVLRGTLLRVNSGAHKPTLCSN